MMSATDELRRMLDERGVEWWAEDDPEEPAYYFVTKWFTMIRINIVSELKQNSFQAHYKL